MKKYISILSICLTIALVSCFDERDEGYDLIGRVATIPVLTLSPTSAPVGDNVSVNFRYYSEHEDVIELRLIQIVGEQAVEVSTKTITGHNKENSYEDSFTYTVPEMDAGTVVALRVEVVTANNLSNGRQANLTITS